MSLFPKALVVLAILTTVLAGKTYYPEGCEQASYNTADFCVLICDGDDACKDNLSVPPSSTIKHFIVRCVRGDPSCTSLGSFNNKRSGVAIYLLCIEKCNSAEDAANSANYVYCAGDGCNSSGNSKGVSSVTEKNGLPVVIFDNDIALLRQELPDKQSDLGIISNGAVHIFPIALSACCR